MSNKFGNELFEELYVPICHKIITLEQATDIVNELAKLTVTKVLPGEKLKVIAIELAVLAGGILRNQNLLINNPEGRKVPDDYMILICERLKKILDVLLKKGDILK